MFFMSLIINKLLIILSFAFCAVGQVDRSKCCSMLDIACLINIPLTVDGFADRVLYRERSGCTAVSVVVILTIIVIGTGIFGQS